MTKENKRFYFEVLVFFLAWYFLYQNIKNDLLIRSDLVSNTVTFLSIVFGFYITSFSIFTTSKYVASLYKIDDKDNTNKQSLMHSLINKYEIGLTLSLISLFYSISLLQVFYDKETILLGSHWYLFLFFPLIFLNFIYGFEMMNILVKVIKQTAKMNNS